MSSAAGDDSGTDSDGEPGGEPGTGSGGAPGTGSGRAPGGRAAAAGSDVAAASGNSAGAASGAASVTPTGAGAGLGHGRAETPVRSRSAEGFEVANPPADRFLTAQMWWLASELVRRHPHLRISGVEVGGGTRLLIVHDEQNAMSIQWDLVGGCKFLVNGAVTRIGWTEMMASLSPHESVHRIEVASGLGIPKTPPVSTKRALAYRVIASALATATNDPHEWYAVPAPMQHQESPEKPACEYFHGFPSTIKARADYVAMTLEEFEAGSRSVYFFQPFWALLRDLEPVALVDAGGVIHTARGATELLPLYERTHRMLSITTAQVLGAYLS